MLLPALFQFLGGLSVLLICAQLLISMTKVLAARWRLSPLFVSLVLVAFGTNVPELVVTVTSILQHDPGLALGNIIGSNVANISLIFGTAILVGSPKIGNHKTPKNALLMLTMTLMFIILRLLQLPFDLQGLILIGTTILILVYQYLMAQRGRTKEDKAFIKVAKPSKGAKIHKQYPLWFNLVVVTGTLIGLALAGQITTTSLETIAEVTQLSTTVLGMTMLAVATSFPELVTILVASYKKEDKILVGTIIGSNIYNLGFFAGILSLAQPQAYLSINDQVFLALTALLFTWIVLFWQGRRVPRKLGGLFLAIFLIFVLQVFLV